MICTLRRELIDIGTDTVNDAYGADPDLDADALIETSEQRLFDLAVSGASGDAGFPDVREHTRR